jgi:hypothetical protein
MTVTEMIYNLMQYDGNLKFVISDMLGQEYRIDDFVPGSPTSNVINTQLDIVIALDHQESPND